MPFEAHETQRHAANASEHAGEPEPQHLRSPHARQANAVLLRVGCGRNGERGSAAQLTTSF